MSNSTPRYAELLADIKKLAGEPMIGTQRQVLMRAELAIIELEAELNRKRAGWIGVDLDGTLAHYDGWKGWHHVGAPVPAMVERVRRWLEDGRDVRIFTARVSHDGTPARIVEAQHALIVIMDWCEQHFGRTLPVVCIKDAAMLELWDDRAVQVKPNFGEPVGFSTRGLA
jgi:hypothetical protein